MQDAACAIMWTKVDGLNCQRGRVRGVGGGENFDCDLAADAGVAGLVHFPHAAGADRRQDFIRTEPCAGVERHIVTALSQQPEPVRRFRL